MKRAGEWSYQEKPFWKRENALQEPTRHNAAFIHEILKIYRSKNSVLSYADVQAFLGKINQWRIAIQCHMIQSKIIKKELKEIFTVTDNNTRFQLNVTKSFDLLRLGHFDRLSRHQVVAEVARFVAIFFDIHCRDLEHGFQLVEMLLTMHGGVEMAILVIWQAELSHFDGGIDLSDLLETIFRHL